MVRRVLVLVVVVGSGTAVACSREEVAKTTPTPTPTCSGWRMHGLPRGARDVVAGGGKAWLLTDSGLYRWTATCGWELRSRKVSVNWDAESMGTGAGSGRATDGLTIDGPLWIDADHRLWLLQAWEGEEVCGGSPQLVECYRRAGRELLSRFDDETATWSSESERPAALPSSRPAPSVPAITEQSPDSRLLALAEDGEHAWVVATRLQPWRRKTGGWSGLTVPELWERTSKHGDWTVRRPISVDLGAAPFIVTHAIDELVVESERLYAGTDDGVALRLDGDTWTAIGDNLRDSYSPLTGMAVFDGVPWLANTCEVTRHPDAQTLETKLPADQHCGIAAMWGRAASDVWVMGHERTVKHFDGATWTALPAPPPRDLRTLWAAGADDVWIGGPTLLHGDGSTWTDEAAGLMGACTTNRGHPYVTALAGAGAKDVWAVGALCGERPFAAHWDGLSWTLRTEGFTSTHVLEALVVRGTKDVYAVGQGVHHWNGKTWEELPAPSGARLRSVAVTEDSLWVGDENGTIYQRSL